MNHPLLNIAIQAARNAGKLIVRSLDHVEAGDITDKQRTEFATRVARAAEEEIVAAIREAYPEHSILSAELGQQKTSNEVEWIIDPLNGKSNFCHGLAHFAISMGIKLRNQLEVGMVFDPIKNELFVAARGRGAMMNNRKIRVSNCHKVEDVLLAGNHAALSSKVAGTRYFGAPALDLAYLAAGRFDAYTEVNLNVWDAAAGVLLVKEAGGLVTDSVGKDEYLNSGSLLAANLKLHSVLLSALLR